jgi:hypothetical protein
MKNEVVVLYTSDDWVGYFVNGKLVDEGHPGDAGRGGVKWLSEFCEKYSVTLHDFVEGSADYEYEQEVLNIFGSFSEDLSMIPWHE